MTQIFENYSSPWLNDELSLLRDAAAKFFTTQLAPANERWIEQGQVDRDAWTKAGAAGFLCAEMPTEYGGGGGDYRHETVIMEEQLRAGYGQVRKRGCDESLPAPHQHPDRGGTHSPWNSR